MQSISKKTPYINSSEAARLATDPRRAITAKVKPAFARFQAQLGQIATRRLALRSKRLGRYSLSFCAMAFACTLVFLPPLVASAQTASEESSSELVVNINEADVEELARGLLGVGPSKAMSIVRYREQYGRFESLEELGEVKGIGAATVERNRSSIVLQ